MKRNHLTWLLIGVVVISIVVIAYLSMTRNKGNYTEEDLKQVHASLKEEMDSKLQSIQQRYEVDDGDGGIPDTHVGGPSQEAQGGAKGSGGTIALFHSNGCPPCRAMMDDWATFKSSGVCVGNDIIVREFEGGDIRQHGITGTPTIRFYPAGTFPDPSKALVYKGDRSSASIIRFAQSKGMGS